MRPPVLRATFAGPRSNELVVAEEHAARFWSRVDRLGPVVRHELGRCWIWTGGRLHRKNGELSYGRFCIGKKSFLAHRVAIAIEAGSLPPDAVVLHRCDNPACVRPDHLLVGTQADNLADMREKGRAHFNRFPAGEQHPRSKLTSDAVRRIRSLRSEGLSLAKIGAVVGVHASTVHDIVTSKTWRGA